MSERKAIPEDIEFDPTYRRQRLLARYALGLAINALRGARPCWADAPDQKKVADMLQAAAVENGIIVFDDFHHAPMCRANHWHFASMPTGPCTCGAASSVPRATRVETKSGAPKIDTKESAASDGGDR
jgi:hypothetical protein